MNEMSAEVEGEGELLGKTMGEVIGLLKNATAEIASSDLSVEMLSLFLKEPGGEGRANSVMRKNASHLLAVIGTRLAATWRCTERAGKRAGGLSALLTRLQGQLLKEAGNQKRMMAMVG